MPPPLQVRLRRGLCAMAADFDAGVRKSQQKFGVARERFDRQLQLWRKDSTPDQQNDL